LAGETEVLGENLPQRYFCPSQNPTCPPGFEPGPPRWEAGDIPLHGDRNTRMCWGKAARSLTLNNKCVKCVCGHGFTFVEREAVTLSRKVDGPFSQSGNAAQMESA
jgi:hypothetical protein